MVLIGVDCVYLCVLISAATCCKGALAASSKRRKQDDAGTERPDERRVVFCLHTSPGTMVFGINCVSNWNKIEKCLQIIDEGSKANLLTTTFTRALASATAGAPNHSGPMGLQVRTLM